MSEKKAKQQEKEKPVSDHFTRTIKEYLDNQAVVNPLFKSKYENLKKSISECCGYIVEEVRKMNVRGLTDDEVFGMAIHYYEEEDLKGHPYKPSNVVVNHVVTLTKEEKEEQKQKALEEYKERKIQELKKEEQKAEEEKKKAIALAEAKEKEKKEKELERIKKKEEEIGQLTLF